MTFIGFFFLRVVPFPGAYSSLSTEDARERPLSNPLIRSKSGESKHSTRNLPGEPGMQPTISYENIPKDSGTEDEAPEVHDMGTEETSSLLSKSSSSIPGDLVNPDDDIKDVTGFYSRHPDISGLAMVSTIDFWQLFALLGLLAGVGLMTIK